MLAAGIDDTLRFWDMGLSRRSARRSLVTKTLLGGWRFPVTDELGFAESWKVGFGSTEEDDLGIPARITKALKTIPLGELVFASHVRGSGVLRIDRSRRLA
jgi:hypothetical protein